MTRPVVLYLASLDDARTALLPVAGQPLAFRTVLAAIRAGARQVLVPAVFRGTMLERAIAGSPRARAAVGWLPGTPVPDPPKLLLPASSLAPAAVLARLLVARAPTLLAESRDSGAPVVLADPRLSRTLASHLAEGVPVGAALAAALDSATPTLSGDTWFVRVQGVRDARRAEARLFADLGSAIDTRLDRLVHRRLSRPVSRLAVAHGVGPNAITLASLAVGLGAAWCLWNASATSALAGVGLYLVAVVLDHADGEVARLTLTESPLGEWLDVATDTVIHALVVLALGATTAGVAGGAGATLGALAALGVVASAIVAKVAPPVERGYRSDRLGRLLGSLGNRDGYYAMLVGFVLALAVRPGALVFLMALVAVGAHAYWVGRAAYALERR